MSDAQYQRLPFVLDELGGLAVQYKNISEGNNLSDISNFAETLIGINQRYPLTPVDDYAQQIISHLVIFDIQAIKLSISQYPKLLAALESCKAAG